MRSSFFNHITLLILFDLLVGVSSTYGQSSFTIIGSGQAIQNGDVLYLLYKENGQNILDSTVASNNSFMFRGSITQPHKASIYRNENPYAVAIVTEGVNVYLEPDTIYVASPDALAGAVVSGTGLNDTLQLLQTRLKNIKQHLGSIKDPELFTEAEKQDTARLNKNKRELEKTFYQMVDIELAFAEQHPHSHVSLDILLDRSRINRYIEKIQTIFNKLSPSLKLTPEGQIIEERVLKKRLLRKGMKAIDFALNNADSATINLSSFKGKYVLLDFWASWCGPCRDEHPNLATLYEKYRQKGFTILSVSIDTDKNRWMDAIAADNLIWTQVSDLKGSQGEVYRKYGITSIPANFLINPEGIIIAKDLNGEELKAELANLFFEADNR